MDPSTKSNTVRVAFTLDKTFLPTLDPAKIGSFQQGLLLDNLYSRLIEYNQYGEIQSGLASKFYWHDSELIFEFDDRVRSRDNLAVSAKDAAFSIRRALYLGTSTHINLRLFLCKIDSVPEVFEDCDGVKVIDNKLILKITNMKHKPFLIPALASIDFGIIPERAVDRTSLTISNFQITSGPYSLENPWKDTQVSRLTLKANPRHFNLTENSFQHIELISPEKNSSAGEMILKDLVDIVPTSFSISQESLTRLNSSIKDLNVSTTLDIKTIVLKFSPISVTKYSFKQRAYIAKKMILLMKKEYPLPTGARESIQFFFDIGFGHLSNSQIDELAELRNIANTPIFTSRPTFYLYKSLENIFSIFKQLDCIEPIVTSESPFATPPDQRLDSFIAFTDTAFEDNLAFLGYNLTQGTFGLDPTESEKWMNNYMETEDVNKRFLMARELQFQSLKKGVMFPLFMAPYTALSRNGFQIGLSKYFATTHFWQIVKNE